MSSYLLQELPQTTTVSETEVPRPEYPQPQFQRAEWLNLNGTWQFAFDDQNVGLDENWAVNNPDFGRQILVPFCFECPKSGIDDHTFHPVMWYRRSLEVPANWAGRRIILHFGAVDYRAMVWLNGRYLGEHEGGSTPFKFDVTEALQPGENCLTVRVEDPPHDRYIPRGKQHWELNSESIFYKRTSGIWQTVWMEPVGTSYLDRVRTNATIDGAVTFDVRVARPVEGLEFHVAVRYNGQLLAGSMGAVSGPRASAGVVIRSPKLWSHHQPSLYDVTLELRQDGQVLDQVQSYFGIRSIAVQDGQILLNGNPIYLKTVLDQGYWPDTNLTPPSDEAIQFDIRATKEMGFNGARKHQKVEDPRYLYWADKMGLLVSSEMANAYMYDEDYVQKINREWIEIVQRDYNHPSIIIWVPINESWGIPNAADPHQQMHLRAMYTLTKSLDMTRLVIDNDGWEHTEMTDLFAIHDYTRSGDILLERFKDVGKPGVPVPNFAKANLVPGAEYNGSPIFLSEFGGISYIPPAELGDVPDDSWGYSGIEKSDIDTLNRMRGLYEAIANIPAIKAICYTQLADVEQEVNGLLTYDRKPKFDFRFIREINNILTAKTSA